MSRPSFTQPVGSTVKFTIPPDWFITISAISRKTYQQGIFVQTNAFDASVLFHSVKGSSGPMPDAANGKTTFPVEPRDHPVTLDVAVYFNEGASNVKARDFMKPQYASSKLDVQFSAKPEFASANIPDYVTYFVFVEDTPDSAQVAGSGQFDDSVLTIHVVKINPNPIPPPPPPDVIKPYNPVLDLPRPSTFENYLKQYDVHFLIDDSGSMADENRWVEARNALDGIANVVIDKGFDANGIDLSFLNSDALFRFRDEVRDITDKGKVAAAMTKVGPNGNTPTGTRVSQILNAHMDRLDAVKGQQAYAEIKPLDLIVITDGVPNDPPQFELTDVLVKLGRRIKNDKHHPNSLGVQFVQIGSDPAAAVNLPKLVQADTGHIVDTVPYAGPGTISPDKLERILLGGLHPNIRAQQIP
ncbi:putative von Willebrand factor type A domain [Lyophyllum shimeji]|uniref:von Willebrand factor type A domain n=1 Tax=Lyophyllum shimeji TaxID=47721 RepID=A0A9P3US59_LYOSH|nr:putative von Willebrand factor type A domain [Lyophyllum shimeji]